MLRKTPSMKEEEINDCSSKFSILNLNDDDDNDEYVYISDQEEFDRILNQKIDKIQKKLSTSREVSFESQRKFATNKTKRITNEVYDRNIENQYATTEIMIIDYVKRFLNSDAATKKELNIFKKEKQTQEEMKQHKTLN